MKAPYIGYSQPKEAVEVMHRLKEVFDPKGIMVSLSLISGPALPDLGSPAEPV
jgi:FAD/FMN-containing dehydrogenase